MPQIKQRRGRFTAIKRSLPLHRLVFPLSLDNICRRSGAFALDERHWKQRQAWNIAFLKIDDALHRKSAQVFNRLMNGR